MSQNVEMTKIEYSRMLLNMVIPNERKENFDESVVQIGLISVRV